MTLPAGCTRELRAVLELGDAKAVLLACSGADAHAHDRYAESALRQSTGRAEIAVVRRPSGRPSLLPPLPEFGVSLSIRNGWLLAGFSPRSAVGVDIELASSVRTSDAARLARDHFSTREATAIAELAPAAACDLFLRLWVAKEALLKTSGRGVFDGLSDPDLSCVIGRLGQGDVEVELSAGKWQGYKLKVCRLQVCQLQPSAVTGVANADQAMAHQLGPAFLSLACGHA